MENDLQINITAVDDASAVLDGVSETADSMSLSINEAINSVDSALGTMQETVQSTAVTWEESMVQLTEAMTLADETAVEAGSAFDTAVEEMAATAAVSAEQIEGSMKGVSEATALSGGAGILGLGIALKAVGQPIQDFYKNSVAAFEGVESSISTLTPAIQNLINQGKDLVAGDGEITAIKKDLIDKINAQKAALMELEVPISGHNKTTIQLAAANARAAAEIQVHMDTLAQLEGQLDRFDNTATMANGDLISLTNTLEDQAKKNINLGFTYEDSLKSLQQLTQETGSVQVGLEANNDAMELSRSRNISLSDATNAVAQAYNGQGRSLAQIGILIKDGVAGNAALRAISEQTAGSITASMGTMAVQLGVLGAQWNKFMSDLGGGQSSVLGPLIKMMTDIVKGLDAWTQAHPLLTQAIMIFIGVLGTLFVLIGGAIVIIGLLSLGITAAAGAWTLAAIVVAAAVAAIAGVIVSHFTATKEWLKQNGGEILGAIKGTWDAVVDYLSDKELAIYNNMVTGFNKVLAWVKQIWGDISNAITGTISSIESAIDGLINKIGSALSSIAKLPGNAISGIVNGASNVIGGTIRAFADGGIVNGPTLAMVGEAGPEAIIPLSSFSGGSTLGGVGGGPGGSSIIINVGNIYGTDAGAVRNMMNTVARAINQQIKLKNF